MEVCSSTAVQVIGADVTCECLSRTVPSDHCGRKATSKGSVDAMRDCVRLGGVTEGGPEVEAEVVVDVEADFKLDGSP